jgi:preprotein translocase subunit SecF
MRFFHHTKIRFMEYRWHWIVASTTLNLIAIGLIFFGPGFKYGVDFAGGTQLTLKFKSDPDLGRIRNALEALKLGEVSIQRFDEANLHQILIHMQNPKGEEGDFSARMLQALKQEFGGVGDKLEMNLQGSDALRDALVQADPDKVAGSFDGRRDHYKPMVDEILGLRKRLGILSGPGDLKALTGVSQGVRDYLGSQAHFSDFALLAAENVGPVVGKDLRQKATYAVTFSLLGMLAYIWFRFKLQYGIGAIVANIHDTLITLGALVITGRPLNLPTIAALLTLVGYSTNDTVVIFDRIRERLKLDRGKPLIEVMDLAINQTLSRTIITSGLTWIVVVGLFLFGGDVINTFAFVLVVGIIVGTYSSIYIASPIALGMSTWIESRKQAKRRR